MNAFTFYGKLAKENDGKVNVIMNDPKGYRVMTIDGRNEINEMDGILYKIYPTIEDAKKSNQLKKYLYPIFVIEQNGTDFSNAIIK